MAINRPENLFEDVQASQYEENRRGFPELAAKVGRRALPQSARPTPNADANAAAGHRERTTQMIRLAGLMASGHRAIGPSWPTRRAGACPRSSPSTGR